MGTRAGIAGRLGEAGLSFRARSRFGSFSFLLPVAAGFAGAAAAPRGSRRVSPRARVAPAVSGSRRSGLSVLSDTLFSSPSAPLTSRSLAATPRSPSAAATRAQTVALCRRSAALASTRPQAPHAEADAERRGAQRLIRVHGRGRVRGSDAPFQRRGSLVERREVLRASRRRHGERRAQRLPASRRARRVSASRLLVAFAPLGLIFRLLHTPRVIGVLEHRGDALGERVHGAHAQDRRQAPTAASISARSWSRLSLDGGVSGLSGESDSGTLHA